MNKPMRFVVSAVLTAFSTAAFCDEEPVVFTGEPATTAGELSSDMFLTGSNWADGDVPSPEKRYKASKTGYYSIGGGKTFNGQSLELTAGNLVMTAAGSTFEFANDGLILNGVTLNTKSTKDPGHAYAKNMTIRGKVDFRKTTAFYAYRDRTSSKVTFAGPSISCAAAASVRVIAPGEAASLATGTIAYHTRFLGDMSEFYGTLQAGDSSTAILGFVLLCTDNFAGTVLVSGGENGGNFGSGTFAPCSTNASGEVTEYVGEAKIANLTLEDNCSLVLAVKPELGATGCGTITVTEGYSGEGGVNLFIESDFPAYNMSERVFPLLTVPEGCGLGETKFKPIFTSDDPVNGICEFRVVTNESAATESYCLVLPKYSTHTATAESYAASSSSADHFKGYWNWDYAADDRTSFDEETVYVSSVNVFDCGTGATGVFGGRRLVMSGTAKLGEYSVNLSLQSCSLFDSSFIDINCNNNFTISGELGVYGSGNYIQQDSNTARDDVTLSATSALVGDGALAFRGLATTTVSLNGNAEAFFGKLSVTRWSDTVDVDDGNHVVLQIDDASVLGSATDSQTFVHDALELSAYSRLKVRETTTMPHAARGLYVDGNGGIDVAAGKTFSYMAPLTLDGRLVKEGDGLFALGGTLRLSTVDEEPADGGVHLLEVAGGSIAALSPEAFNGATISFAEGASLCVDVGATDAELLAKGLVNTKADTPFETAASDGKIAISFRATGATGSAAKSVAVCTVSMSSPYSDVGKYAFSGDERIGDLRFRGFSQVPNADETMTIFAHFSAKPGLILIVK